MRGLKPDARRIAFCLLHLRGRPAEIAATAVYNRPTETNGSSSKRRFKHRPYPDADCRRLGGGVPRCYWQTINEAIHRAGSRQEPEDAKKL